uniref:Uncharacterized protein n=1 Tax=Prorocentrum micans TaxID=2945 RepID=A0A7S2TBM6_PROMC
MPLRPSMMITLESTLSRLLLFALGTPRCLFCGLFLQLQQELHVLAISLTLLHACARTLRYLLALNLLELPLFVVEHVRHFVGSCRVRAWTTGKRTLRQHLP